MKPALFAMVLVMSGFGRSADQPTGLPPLPSPATVSKLEAETVKLLGSSFQPVFVCGGSAGRTFQPTQSATNWVDAAGPAAVVLAIRVNCRQR